MSIVNVKDSFHLESTFKLLSEKNSTRILFELNLFRITNIHKYNNLFINLSRNDLMYKKSHYLNKVNGLDYYVI